MDTSYSLRKDEISDNNEAKSLFTEIRENTKSIENKQDKNHVNENQCEQTCEILEPNIHGIQPPDGGCRAWLVMFGSFLCNGIIFGTINSGGIIFLELTNLLKKNGEENPAAQASVTLSLAIGITFFLSLVSGILTDKLGIRITTVIGGGIATLGMFLSSLFFMQVKMLALTMGVIFGIGASLAYTPSLVILGHYFFRRLGIVNGFVTAGSSVFTIIITQTLNVTIDQYGLKVSFQLLAAMMSILMLCGLAFKPILPRVANSSENDGIVRRKSCYKFKTFMRELINVNIWKNKHYVVWALAIPLALFGYFVPYIHLMKFAEDVLGADTSTEILVQCIGISSGVGRILFGLIADKPWVNRIVLQQISFYSIGTLTMLLTLADRFWIFIVISLAMGLFDGCFISLLGPIAFDIVGPNNASQAIGCLLALCALPLTLGPYVAGVMYDHYGDYTIPFICAGIPPLIGGSALFLMRCIRVESNAETEAPCVEKEEIKNNVDIKKESRPEDVPLMKDSEASNGGVSKLDENSIQVDVKRLVTLQRESCV